uniref:Uncharacterized protein n=1 Tax=Arundo donax TaxID=35708 RepID=A0A0A9E5X8_ARUDO
MASSFISMYSDLEASNNTWKEKQWREGNTSLRSSCNDGLFIASIWCRLSSMKLLAIISVGTTMFFLLPLKLKTGGLSYAISVNCLYVSIVYNGFNS